MDFAAWNPVVWGLFLGFAALTWGVVRGFRARYPDYPGRVPPQGE